MLAAAVSCVILLATACTDSPILPNEPSNSQAYLQTTDTLADGNLNLAASMDEDVVKWMAELFSEQTGCSVSYAVMGAAEAERFFLDLNGSKKVDVYLGGTANLHERLKRAHLLERYLSDERVHHDTRFMDDDGYWSSFCLELYAIGYHPQAFAETFENEALPQTLQELADPKYRGHLLLPNPDTSFGGDTWCVSVIQSRAQKEGVELLENLLNNAETYAQNDLTATQKTGLGMYPIMVGRLSDQIRMKNAGLMIESVVYPDTGWTITPVALLSGCGHPNEGKAFIDFVLSREVGRRIQQQCGSFSTREDAAPPPDSQNQLSDYPLSKSGWAYQNNLLREDVRAMLDQYKKPA